jgi:pyruvate formate lyase activating enzyme
VQIGFKNLIIRTPIIPSINDDYEFITTLAQFMKNLGLKEVHLLPYHRLAEKKYERLGLEYPLKNLPPLEQKTLLEFKKILESESITVKIGGS